VTRAEIDDHPRAGVFAVERGVAELELTHRLIQLILEQRISGVLVPSEIAGYLFASNYRLCGAVSSTVYSLIAVSSAAMSAAVTP
jgi:hypothetical protein